MTIFSYRVKHLIKHLISRQDCRLYKSVLLISSSQKVKMLRYLNFRKFANYMLIKFFNLRAESWFIIDCLTYSEVTLNEN